MADGSITIEAKIETKKFDRQMWSIEKRIEYLNEYIEKGHEFNFPVENINKAKIEVEKLTNSLIRLKDQRDKIAKQSLNTSLGQVGNIGFNYNTNIASGFSLARSGISGKALGDLEQKTEYVADSVKDLNNAFTETGQKVDEVGQKTSHSFDRGIKSLKRFALGLFGVRSMFSVLTRATNSYLSQNETTANKLNAIWVALGNALGPIIEIIADGVLKLIGYLNVFLQALGLDVDLTKNMNKNTKAIGGTAKAMKELNNEVYSFDEMNKQQSQDTGGSGGGGGIGGTNGFEMPELDEGIVNKLKDIAKWLKENWQLIGLIIGAIGAIKVAKWLASLASLLGGPTAGLIGIAKVLTGLLAIGMLIIEIKLITNFLEEMANLRDLNKSVSEFSRNVSKEADRVNDKNLETALSYEKGSEEIEKYVTGLKQQIDTSKDIVKQKEHEMASNDALGEVLDDISGKTQKNTSIITDNTREIVNNASRLQTLAKEGKLTDEQMEIYAQTMDYVNTLYGENKEAIEEIKNPFSTYSKLIDDSTRETLEQIEAVKKQDEQMRTSTEREARYYDNLYTSMDKAFGNINNLTARPQVKPKVETTELQRLLKTLSEMPGGSAFNVAYKTIRVMGLASGGIVYNPGRGVALNSAVVGEATNGPEGVIPMNNAESMDLIGQSIARHIKINLTNNTMLDNRVISREQKIINNDIDFVTNGRGA